MTEYAQARVVQITGRDASVVDTDAANDPPRVTVIQIDNDLFQVDVDDRDGDRVTCTATQPFSGTVADLGKWPRHVADGFPFGLAPNESAVVLYVLPPSAAPVVVVEFNDETGVPWSRANDEDPERVSSSA
jgi:hypothetical protein